jgi:uncharacterized protein (DUF779 family)
MVLEATVVRPGETRSRVALSEPALDLLRRLWTRHGALMFHQSGGCCDGSSPMCYPAGDFITSAADVRLGTFDIALSGEAARLVDFWISVEQFAYWSHTHLTVDVVTGRGSGFSVEAPEGVRFLIRSRLMEAAEPFA